MIEAVTENLAIKQALLEKVAPHLKRGRHPDHQHQRPAGGVHRRQIAGAAPPALVRHPLFQSAALHAAGGNHRHAGDRPGRDRRRSRTSPTCGWARKWCSRATRPTSSPTASASSSCWKRVRLMQEEDLTIEEVDALTGTAIGWPRTGTFRLADLVGIDVLAHVAANFRGFRRAELPPFRRRPCWSGAGWATRPSRASTRKRRTPRAKKSAWCSIGRPCEYVPAVRPKLPSLEMAKNAEQLARPPAQLLAGRRPQGQSRALPLAPAERALELCGRLPAGDRRRRRQRGSRHARRLQLGNGSVPTLGRGRRAANRGSACRPRASR